MFIQWARASFSALCTEHSQRTCSVICLLILQAPSGEWVWRNVCIWLVNLMSVAFTEEAAWLWFRACPGFLYQDGHLSQTFALNDYNKWIGGGMLPRSWPRASKSEWHCLSQDHVRWTSMSPWMFEFPLRSADLWPYLRSMVYLSDNHNSCLFIKVSDLVTLLLMFTSNVCNVVVVLCGFLKIILWKSVTGS